MRRYGVRILVAVLTFLLGIALSFGLGLFRAGQNKFSYNWESKKDCDKRFRSSTATPFIIYNDEGAPVQLTLLGPTTDTAYQREQMLQVLVENKSNRTVSSYLLTGERVWKKNSFAFVDDTTTTTLKPGDSHVNLVPNFAGARMSLGVSRVDFQDGFTWNSTRAIR